MIDRGRYYSRISFSQPLTAHGRNGVSQAHGIEVTQMLATDEIWLEPVNSRGEITRCRVPVPRDALPALIQELQRLV